MVWEHLAQIVFSLLFLFFVCSRSSTILSAKKLLWEKWFLTMTMTMKKKKWKKKNKKSSSSKCNFFENYYYSFAIDVNAHCRALFLFHFFFFRLRTANPFPDCRHHRQSSPSCAHVHQPILFINAFRYVVVYPLRCSRAHQFDNFMIGLSDRSNAWYTFQCFYHQDVIKSNTTLEERRKKNWT